MMRMKAGWHSNRVCRWPLERLEGNLNWTVFVSLSRWWMVDGDGDDEAEVRRFGGQGYKWCSELCKSA